jgi:hypothetical protein
MVPGFDIWGMGIDHPASPEQRQAAADDAVDKGDDFLPAVFVIPAYNHVHESVGQMGIEHFKLRVGSIAKLWLKERENGLTQQNSADKL